MPIRVGLNRKLQRAKIIVVEPQGFPLALERLDQKKSRKRNHASPSRILGADEQIVIQCMTKSHKATGRNCFTCSSFVPGCRAALT